MSETIPKTSNIEIYVENLVKTEAIATQLAEIVEAGTIMLLEGNLGSGKTAFMQAFGRALGINTTITSPTFTLIDEYTEGRLPLYHIDLYRLEPDQVPSLHLEAYWRGEDVPLGVVAIEWSSKLINMPPEHLQIYLFIPEEIQDLTENFNKSLIADLDGKSNENSIAEYLECPLQKRIISIFAQGQKYVEMLNQLQT